MAVWLSNASRRRGAAFCVATGLVSAVLFVTCTIERHESEHDQLADDLAANRALWDRHGIHSYSYLLSIGCDSCVSPKGRFAVAVAQDTVNRVTRDTTVPGYFDSSAGEIPTIIGLFQKIQNALDMSNSDISAHFDSSMGYPESIWVDYNSRIAGDEYTYTVDSISTR